MVSHSIGVSIFNFRCNPRIVRKNGNKRTKKSMLFLGLIGVSVKKSVVKKCMLNLKWKSHYSIRRLQNRFCKISIRKPQHCIKPLCAELANGLLSFSFQGGFNNNFFCEPISDEPLPFEIQSMSDETLPIEIQPLPLCREIEPMSDEPLILSEMHYPLWNNNKFLNPRNYSPPHGYAPNNPSVETVKKFNGLLFERVVLCIFQFILHPENRFETTRDILQGCRKHTEIDILVYGPNSKRLVIEAKSGPYKPESSTQIRRHHNLFYKPSDNINLIYVVQQMHLRDWRKKVPQEIAILPIEGFHTPNAKPSISKTDLIKFFNDLGFHHRLK